MTRVLATSTLLACIALLSACNTTDALTPQVDIGDSSAGAAPSAPVTQREAEQLAGTQQRQTFPSQPQQDGYPGAASQPTYQSQPTARAGTGAPPTTMQAQADALARSGPSPSVSAPIQGETLQPPASNQPVQSPVQQQPQETAAIGSTGQNRGNTVRFLPIIGAPVQAVTPLSRQLGAEARSHGLAIKSSNDTSSDYILKGYLSAFTDEGKVTVVYVWDVLDNNGARLHRIQGQETVPTAAEDPWAGVPASVMQQIASKTIAEFSSWRQTSGG